MAVLAHTKISKAESARTLDRPFDKHRISLITNLLLFSGRFPRPAFLDGGWAGQAGAAGGHGEGHALRRAGPVHMRMLGPPHAHLPRAAAQARTSVRDERRGIDG